mmetsp:Transcript_11591/g.21683  ORF Transcript_11591/g.21683 Transcript_11591/m.21683 type:complete len:93 (-) Transcript_11591:291-569(-)
MERRINCFHTISYYPYNEHRERNTAFTLQHFNTILQYTASSTATKYSTTVYRLSAVKYVQAYLLHNQAAAERRNQKRVTQTKEAHNNGSNQQ